MAPMEVSTPLRSTSIENESIAYALRQVAEILQAQGANAYRINAYRRAAETVEGTAPLRGIYKTQGRTGLEALPGVGQVIANAIAEMLDTGHWSQLERLRGSLDPATLFRTVPGIGPELAERIHDELGIDTLEALELACYDGRLEAVPGVGHRRVASIRAALADLLGHARLRTRTRQGDGEPPIAMLLDVDREYREAVRTDRLPRIAPRRFNPDNRSWLPILHTMRGPWHFTALYSNTARAHELGRTRDWVVLYFYDADHPEQQRTIVTEQRGALGGLRVVRGREADCEAYYGTAGTPAAHQH